MVVDISQNVSNLPGIIGEVGQIALWLQALGGIIILWMIAEGFTFYFNRKRLKEVHIIKKDMVRIEEKIDRILNKRK